MHALVIGGAAAAVGAFVTASITIILLMICVAVIVTASREQTIRSLRLATVNARQFGGILLVAVGLWFIALAVWADFFAEVFPV